MTRFIFAALAAFAAACAQANADNAGTQANTPKEVKVAAAGQDCKGGQGCGGGGATASASAVKVPLDSSPVLGRSDAPITLVEFTDYECPFCIRAHGTVEKLLAEYGGKLRLAVKHNPLPMHARAQPAARAVLAAGLSGKYWELHRALFAEGRKLDDGGIAAAWREVGLDPAGLQSALADARIDEALKRDQALAGAIGANGTPTFYVNGRRIQGAQPIEAFRAVIDAELARANELIAAGTRPDELYARLQETASATPPPEAAAPSPIAPASERVKVDVGSAPARGGVSSPVTLVVFSDFQCPFCARAANTVHAVEQRFGDRVRIAFRNKPLPMHKDARLAAAAAMAAHEQGKFWQFHDALFTHQQELDRKGLERRAEELGLDLFRFKDALDRGTSEAAIAADESEAQRLGVNGTPTFFVNGRRINGAQPIEKIAAVIEEELQQR